MLEFRKYPPETPEEERKGSPVCVVTYPESCGCPAVGEVWGLPFCEAHGTEAVAAARLEAYEDAGREIDALMGTLEGEHAVRNPLVYEVLRGAKFPSGYADSPGHADAIRRTYALDAAETDPATLAHEYDDEGDTPYDWWCEARELAVGWMREAYEASQRPLLVALEEMRERATVQQELALRDMERRYVEPRRAAREYSRKREAERAAVRHPSAEILAAANASIASAVEGLESLPDDGPFDREAVRRAGVAAASAGEIVATEERRVFIDEERRRRAARDERPGSAA